MKRSYDYEHQIDYKPMLNPDEGIAIKYTDIEGESGRDESGFMHRIVVRSNVRTWTFSYSVLTEQEYVYLKSLYQGKVTFQFTFAGDEGRTETIQAYCNETSISYQNKRSGLYKNLKLDIIEC